MRSDADDSSPAWSADGTRLAFLSDRDGSSQVWVIPVDGGEAKKITDIPTDVSSFVWSPDGRTIALVSSVYPECADMKCNEKMRDDAKNAKVKGRLVDHLLYRHWNSWRNGKWSHLFVTDIEGSSLVEVNKGRTDVPPIALGGDRDVDFSPDGAELCFAMNPDSIPAASTNNDLYLVPVAGGTPVSITAKNRGNDNNPRYSPDGRFIAYCSMPTPGLESDRVRIVLYDRKAGTISNLTENFDYSVDHFSWSVDSKTLYFSVEDRGRRAIGAVSIRGGDAALIIRGGYDGDLATTRDGKYLVFARQSAKRPVDLYRATVKGKDVTALTAVNASVLAGLEMNAVEEYWYDGALGAKIHCYVVKPPFFEEGKKYPLILLIHGGPQGSFGDDFHYRWNSQMFASPGYVVAMINPHGSTGYGDAFERQISGDWGGAVFEDVLKRRRFPQVAPLRRRNAARGRRGELRRLYGRLARGAHGRPFPLPRLARRRLQPREHVRGDGRALVPRMGVQGNSLDQSRNVREVVAAPVRREFQNPVPRRARRAGLPRAVRGRAPVLHGAPAAGRAVEAPLFPR